MNGPAHQGLLFIRMSRAIFITVAMAASLSLYFTKAQAQVPPITPSGLNTQVDLSTTPLAGHAQYDITGGTRPGGGTNLFHSFGDFNVPNNNIANFLNAGSIDLNGNVLPSNLTTSNILGTVTGVNPSIIFGAIQTNGPGGFGNANLFLMNPYGFLFGPNATVNVGGMVTFTTADYLKLSNGTNNGYFYADPAGPSLLTSAPVTAFGFLGSNAASIAIQGGTLEVPDGKALAFIGGPRTFTTDTGVTVPAGVTMTGGSLSAPNGLIYMATVTSPGEILVPTLSGAPLGLLGPPSLDPTVIRIRSGEFVMDHAFLTTINTNNTAQPPIDINVQGTMTLRSASSISTETFSAGHGSDVHIAAQSLQMDGSSIKSSTTGDGHGGDIAITNVQTVNLSNGAQIVSNTTGTGKGGNITTDATESLIISGFDVDGTLSGVATPFLFNPITGAPLVGSGIYSLTSGTKTATGGVITLTAPTVSLDNGALVATITSGDGAGGNIAVTGATSVTLTGGASVLSSAGLSFSTSEPSGSARGGDISISSTDTVQISGGNTDLFARSSISSQTSGSGGDSGEVTITSPNVIVENAGILSSTSSGSGAGGDITIVALNQLSLSGFSEDFFTGSQISTDVSGAGTTPGGAITITGGSITIADSGVLSTTSRSPDRTAGALSLDVHDATLQQGGSIITQGFGDGSSGHISIQAIGLVSITGQFDIDHPSSIRNNVDESTVGANGSTSVNADRFELTNGALIESGTGSQAYGGTHVIISAQESATISDRAVIAVTPDVGGGGSLEITAPTLTIANLADIRSRALISNRDGGPISLNATAGDLTISGGSLIRNLTESGPGNGGPVLLSASNSIFVTGGARIESSSVVATGNAGVIDVIAGNTVSFSGTGSGLFTEASGTGSGGNIVVSANSVSMTNGSSVSASSTGAGDAGNVSVQGLASPAQSVLIDGSGSGLFTDTQGTGAGGNIFLNANSVTLQNGGTLSAKTSGTEVTATGGTITVEGNTLQLNSGGTITAQSTGSGNAGNVTIQGHAGPADSVVISGFDENFNLSGIFTDTQATGAGGNIHISAKSISFQDSGMLSATTSGTNNGGDIQVDATTIDLRSFASIAALSSLDVSAGNAGNIALKATQQITSVDSFLNTDTAGTGRGGDILLSSPTISVNGGVLNTSTSGPGRAGNILLEGQQISLGASPTAKATGATLSASTNLGSGHGGTISLRGLDGPSSQADVTISGTSMLQTLTGAGGSGNAGDLTINAAQFTLTDHATLNADTFGSGAAGTLTVTATDSAIVSRSTVSSSSDFGATGRAGQISVSAPTVMIENGGHIFTNTTGEGTGGSINILASQSVTLTNASRVSASSSGPGDAGNILINAGQNYTSTNSAVTTQATALGTEASGGNITVLATDMVQLTNSQLNASVQGSSTTVGGNITIDPQYVILQNSQILAQATQGQGGAISIVITNGGLFLPDANSTISASSQFGVNGTITIQSPNAPISGQIQPLGKTPLIATSLLNQRCASLAGGEFSSFTVAGRDSLPTEPGSWLASPLYAAGVGLGIKAEGGKAEGERLEGMSASAGQVVSGQWLSTGEELGVSGEWRVDDTPILSLRQIAPAGFLTQAFALDWSGGCTS